jgi:hypothetical protein
MRKNTVPDGVLAYSRNGVLDGLLARTFLFVLEARAWQLEVHGGL